MTKKITAPYGAWMSPIKSRLLASAAVGLGAIGISADNVYWLESRPLEKGRSVIVRRTPDGAIADVTPPDFNVRTTVHEYGGGAYLLQGETVIFSNFADQRLYRQAAPLPATALPKGEGWSAAWIPTPITPEPDTPLAWRYADGCLTPDGQAIVCVRERHGAGVDNELVVLPSDGRTAPRLIASGHDFYAAPRLSPDGRRLAWLCWDHPNMPWDGCELWVADFSPQSGLSGGRLIAGGATESICQPAWSPAGVLYFISDRSGWWNLYRYQDGQVEPLAPMPADFGQPQWTFGNSHYVFLPNGTLAAVFTQNGRDHLALITPGEGRVEPIETGFTVINSLQCQGERLWFVGASSTQPAAIVTLDLACGKVEIVRSGMNLDVDPAYLSLPRPIEFPTENGLTAHALYYPPTNATYRAPKGELPPLIVRSHGGPTAAAKALLSLDIQFWTSRGFAFVDVNYGGSSGYGREYRQRLNGQWGVVDVMDCINAARFLIRQGEVDERRIIIRGGSAGGYTTLCALTFHKFFSAGVSYFGVADLEALDAITHKFESRYTRNLIGPYPEAKEIYRQRSPVYYAHRISCPVLLLQGLEDKIVPPAQSEMMVQALRERHLPYAYVAFEGEQHGFRQAETIQRAAELELSFYSQVFGLALPEAVETVKIENFARPSK